MIMADANLSIDADAAALIKGDEITHPETGETVTVAWTEIQSNGVVRVVLERADEGDHPYIETTTGQPVSTATTPVTYEIIG